MMRATTVLLGVAMLLCTMSQARASELYSGDVPADVATLPAPATESLSIPLVAFDGEVTLPRMSEPNSWAMLVLGMGIVGVAFRLGRRGAGTA